MALATSASLGARHATIRRAVEALSLDALVVTTPANIRYLTNHAGSAGTLVATAGAMHLLVDFRYQEAVRQLQQTEAACPSMQVWNVAGSYDEALLDCLAEIGIRSAGFEAGHVTVARHEWLAHTAGSRRLAFALRPTQRMIEQSRMIKDDGEVATLRDAARRLTPVALAAFDVVRSGTSERAVAACIDGAIRDAGFERPAFDTIVASGPNGALPHYRAGDRLLERGDLVVLDFGGVLDGYCSDLTRTVAVAPPSAEARRVHQAVREAQQAAIDAVKPGIATTDVDRAARRVLEAHGLGEAFGHGTGHGLGLDVHEEPRVTRPRADVAPMPLEPGMVFTIEPGAYLPGWGGVRIEDDVLVTARGCEVLTSVPYALIPD
jgi:Xaa-Pro aminopeptidase